MYQYFVNGQPASDLLPGSSDLRVGDLVFFRGWLRKVVSVTRSGDVERVDIVQTIGQFRGATVNAMDRFAELTS